METPVLLAYHLLKIFPYICRLPVSYRFKYSAIVISTVPIICVYPFIQKYFVQGVMIGSIKG